MIAALFVGKSAANMRLRPCFYEWQNQIETEVFPLFRCSPRTRSLIRRPKIHSLFHHWLPLVSSNCPTYSEFLPCIFSKCLACFSIFKLSFSSLCKSASLCLALFFKNGDLAISISLFTATSEDNTKCGHVDPWHGQQAHPQTWIIKKLG